MGNSIAERDFPGNPPIILKKISQGQQLKKKGRLDDGKHTHIYFLALSVQFCLIEVKKIH